MKYKNPILIVLLLAVVTFGCVVLSGCIDLGNKNTTDKFTGSEFKMIPFESEAEYNNYFKNVESQTTYGEMMIGGRTNLATDSATMTSMKAETAVGAPAATQSPVAEEKGSATDDRYSETNVQVKGVDEADILKTDGKYIYYKTSTSYNYGKENTYVPERLWVIDALPPEISDIVSDINETGVRGFYLIDEKLVLTCYDSIKCYDITDKTNPKKLWENKFNPERNNEEDYEKYKDVPYTNYVDSRVIDGKMYMVTSQYGNYYPILYGAKEISADRIYAPMLPGPITDIPENKYIVSEVDTETGELKDSVVILANWATTIYASKDNFYLATHYAPDEAGANSEFLKENGNKYFPDDVMKHIIRVMENEDFGERAKRIQVSEIIYTHMETLSPEERNELQERMDKDFSEYFIEIMKENEKTAITRINLESMEITTGEVPGSLLNNYSMDEYNGYLRIGVTIGNNWRTKDDMTNAVYVLDEDLKQVGYVDDIVKGERIYSTRFIGDTLYMVTFEEIDPFFVIDLSIPEDPKILGELKIPGYSTYLHPVGENLVVGVGRIEQNSKLSLFDVSNPEDPIELSTYEFKEYTSAGDDFHAFLWDSETKTLVIPAEEHAYIFHVDESGISLKKDDSHGKYTYVTRTLYINDHLYTFSQKEVHVIDMNTWETVNEIKFPTEVRDDDWWGPYYR